MDDPNSKKPKPPSARKQWKNITDALAEDAINDITPLTAAERVEADRVRRNLLEKAEAEVEKWGQKESKRKAKAKPKYLN